MIQPSIERTATAPVAVCASLVAGGPVPLVGDLGDWTGSISISVEAIVGTMTELTYLTSRKFAASEMVRILALHDTVLTMEVTRY